MAKRRVRVLITGRVQGVFFRAYTRDAAIQSGVAGWVRNLRDGRVEAVFEGDAEPVSKMIDWCHIGSPVSRIDDVQILEEDYTGEFNNFSIAN